MVSATSPAAAMDIFPHQRNLSGIPGQRTTQSETCPGDGRELFFHASGALVADPKHFQLKPSTMAKTKKAAVEKQNPKAKSAPKASPSASPTEACSISGVGREWDQICELKDRLLAGGNPLHPDTPTKQQPDNKTCMLNKDLLTPILQRMSLLPKRPIPTIDDLRDEVTTLLTLSKREGADIVAVIEDTAQTIKHLLVFIKAKTRRWEVSTATWLTGTDEFKMGKLSKALRDCFCLETLFFVCCCMHALWYIATNPWVLQ